MCRIASLFLLQRLKGSMSGDARDFNNIESLVFIKFFFLQDNAPKEIHAILTEKLEEHAPSYGTVKNWGGGQFKRGDFSPKLQLLGIHYDLCLRRDLFLILDLLRIDHKVLDLFASVRSLRTCRSHVAITIRRLSCFVLSSQVIKDKGDVRVDTPWMMCQLRMVWEGTTDTG